VQFSIAEKVVEALAAGEVIRIELVNGAHVSIEEIHGEVFSLIHTETASTDESQAIADVSTFAGTTSLLELFPENKQLSKIGGYLLAVSFSLFITLGLLYTVVQAGVFDKDALLTLSKSGQFADSADNPVWQLEKARKEADKTGLHIKALKKGPQGWNWELSQ